MLKTVFFIFTYIICSSNLMAQKIEFNIQNPENEIEIHTLKFYISNISVVYEDGLAYSEKNSAHLIDISDTISQVIALDEKKKISSLSFDIGTDSSINVAGILDGDLDPILGMYWAWNTGYINLKIEGEKNKKQFEYHLGGYMSPYATVRRKSIVLEKASDEVVIDIHLKEMFDKVDISQTSSILIPGEKAAGLATIFSECFHSNE